MIDALTAASQIMAEDLQRMSIISQNLANVSTTAYKKQFSVSTPFAAAMNLAGGSNQMPVTAGVTLPLPSAVTDLKPGTLRNTGAPLDVAIEDAGFFEVRTEQGLAYTRRGDFRLDGQSRLVTQQGDAVMGSAGEIVLTTSQPTIDQQGGVYENGKLVAQIKVAHFDNPETLVRSGPELLAAGKDTQFSGDGFTRIRQGFLEASNVISMEEMVNIIETMRHFESAQKIVQGYDDMLDKALRKLGEF
jgi:flagellar basal-body rod protein FlgF